MEGYANGLAAYGAADAMDISVGEDAATHQALGSWYQANLQQPSYNGPAAAYRPHVQVGTAGAASELPAGAAAAQEALQSAGATVPPAAPRGMMEAPANTDAASGVFTGVPADVLERTTRVFKFSEAQREAVRSLEQEERRRKCSRLNGSCRACSSARNESTTSISQRTDSPMLRCGSPIPGLQIENLDEAAADEVASEARDDSACEVCQCDYEDEDEVMLLPCSHFFHKSCISRWFAMKTTCPKCRYALSPPVPESREVIVRRTTTIEWMPVMQWVPASTTTVEIRSEVGSDMETVTTTTTRPILLHEMSPVQIAAFYQVGDTRHTGCDVHGERIDRLGEIQSNRGFSGWRYALSIQGMCGCALFRLTSACMCRGIRQQAQGGMLPGGMTAPPHTMHTSAHMHSPPQGARPAVETQSGSLGGGGGNGIGRGGGGGQEASNGEGVGAEQAPTQSNAQPGVMSPFFWGE